ncbi:hypothetical protein B0H19DRAFT_1085349 [Mycena capillaripes]|nr:hypothetical protein B0H19DRAFT_1085349 [Mycena capillaripes]
MSLSVARLGSPPSRLLFFLGFAISCSRTASVNRTIDDYHGDLATGILPVYSKGWIRCPNEGGCCGEASVDSAFDKSYICSVGPPNGTNGANVTLKFPGTAIYVYGLSPHVNFIHSNWVATLDGKEQQSFSADVGGLAKVLMYSKSDLDNTSHTLIIGPSDVNQSFLFDYATYTYEEPATSASLSGNQLKPNLILPIAVGITVGAMFIFSAVMILIRCARLRGILPQRRSAQMIQLSSTDDVTPEPHWQSEITILPSGETQLTLVSQPVPPSSQAPAAAEDTQPQPRTTLQHDTQAPSHEIRELSRGVEDLSYDSEASQAVGADFLRQPHGEHQPNAEIGVPGDETQLSLVSQPVSPLRQASAAVEDTQPQSLTTLQQDIQALSHEIQELSHGVEGLSHDAEASQAAGADLPRPPHDEHQPSVEIGILRERVEAIEQLQLHLQASLSQETAPPAYTPI